MTFYSAYKQLRAHYKRLKYLWVTYSPAGLYAAYFANLSKSAGLEAKYKGNKELFLQECAALELSAHWFPQHIPYWLSLFDEYQFREREIKVLEIGSWEGLSSYFILATLPDAHLTCVDTWEGADEHKAGVAASQDILRTVESRFDANLKRFRGRLQKEKGTSFNFFAKCSPDTQYDLIYVDGSHYCDDVILDAIKSFAVLKVGGILIFDDYFWRSYSSDRDNPAAAINLFLRLKKGDYEIVSLYDQLVIKKVSNIRSATV